MGRHKVVLLAAICSLLVLQAPVSVLAQAPAEAVSQSALAVSPAIMEHVLEPGIATPFSVQINNVTNFPLPIKTLARSFTVQATDLEKTERDRLDASAWFVIDEPDFILQPKQVRTVKGIIRPPADATPGGHYATVFFQPLIPHEVLSPSTAYLNSQVGVLAFLAVKGDTEQKAEYAAPLQAPGLVRHGPVDFIFSIRNSGNVHVLPVGRVAIYDRGGKQVAALQLPPGIILPESTKQYTLSWNAAGALGNYRAELEVTYGNENTPLPAASAVVWVLPWLEVTIGIVVVGGLGFVVLKTRHRWRKAWRTLRGRDVHFK